MVVTCTLRLRPVPAGAFTSASQAGDQSFTLTSDLAAVYGVNPQWHRAHAPREEFTVCDPIVIDGNSPTVAVLTLSQQTLDPIVQMFEAGLGPTPTQPLCFRWPLRDSLSPNSPAAFVSSVAAVNNGGVLVDPNAPAVAGVIDSRFMNTLRHLPAAATLAGFEGLTNEQASSCVRELRQGVGHRRRFDQFLRPERARIDIANRPLHS